MGLHASDFSTLYHKTIGLLEDKYSDMEFEIQCFKEEYENYDGHYTFEGFTICCDSFDYPIQVELYTDAGVTISVRTGPNWDEWNEMKRDTRNGITRINEAINFIDDCIRRKRQPKRHRHYDSPVPQKTSDMKRAIRELEKVKKYIVNNDIDLSDRQIYHPKRISGYIDDCINMMQAYISRYND